MWSEDEILTGYLLDAVDDRSIACYFVKCSSQFLFINESGIVSSGKQFDYSVAGDTLYFVVGKDYMVGTIVPCGDNAFIYKTTDTVVYNPNLPPAELWMFFIRSSFVDK